MLTFIVGETGGQSPAVGHDVSNLRRHVWHRLVQNVPCVHNMAGTEHLSTDRHINSVSVPRTQSQLPSLQRRSLYVPANAPSLL
jgi:hypothetical protein